MKRTNIYCIFLLIIFFSCTKGKEFFQYPYKNPNLPVEKRVADLLDRMTDMEKIKQLDMYWGKEVATMDKNEPPSYSEKKVKSMLDSTGIGSIHDLYPSSAEIVNKIQKYALKKTRLEIPVMVIEEGLHGYVGAGSTTFPVPLHLASSFDTSMVYKTGRVIATEARAHNVHMILGPVLGLAHDPRWGRVEETFGEDPYLAALNGIAMVKGMQGSKLSNKDAVIAEPKHFAVHSIPEAGSNTSPVSIGEREARSTFLYVFEKAVREGGAMGIMAAYHDLDGIPCVDSKWLLTDVLRNEWGFKGFVLSDLGAIWRSLEMHKVAADTCDALVQTLKAGLNMQFYDFNHKSFQRAITRALATKRLTEEDLNKAVGDVLRVKFMLGLFENPYIDTTLVEKVFHTVENQKLALEAAQEGICLLKNEQKILPLREKQTVAVIGSLGASTYLGGYSKKHGEGISILDGLKERAGNSLKINYEKGYGKDSTYSSAMLVKKAEGLVRNSDVAVVVLGENPTITGENKDRANIDLDEEQMNLVKALYQTGKPVVAVLFNGRPLSVNWVARNIPSIVEAWFPGEKSGLAIADVLLGNVNPSGKLPITFPRSTGQIPYYYNHKPTSKHKYVDESDKPLFPFGYGLSYTTFQYSDLQILPDTIEPDGTTTVRITIKNTGDVEGTEVVQLYIRDVISSVTTPVISLKGFRRIPLAPGEFGTVTFTLGSESLSLWNREMKRVVEPGNFDIMIGSSSEDIRQQRTLVVSEKNR